MSMLDAYTYQVGVDWTHGATGTLASDGLPPLQFSAPPEFRGEPGHWTPEHLLTASVASCFMATFFSIARFQKLEVQSFRMRAFARLEKLPGEGYRFTEVTLTPEIGVAQEDVEKTLKVIERAEKSCFVAKSLRATVQVEPNFVPATVELCPQA
jgi:organic hydroperoxide reductase OsmC/OhrA